MVKHARVSHVSGKANRRQRSLLNLVVVAVCLVLAAGSLHLVDPRPSSAAPTGCDAWVLSADALTIREMDESRGLLGNDGDEPYIASVAMRTRVGVKGSTAYWRQGAEREMDADGVTGEALDIPDSSGTVTFSGVTPGEVVAVATLAMENDNPFSSVRGTYRRAIDLIMEKLGGSLAKEFEQQDNPVAVLARTRAMLTDSSGSNDSAAVTELIEYVRSTPGDLKRALRASIDNITVSTDDVWEILGGDPLELLSNIVDPDGFGGLSLQVYGNVEPLRMLATHPLIPANVRQEVSTALDSVLVPLYLRPVDGIQLVFGALRDQHRRMSYEWQGGVFGWLGEHIDMDGEYEIAHTVAGCPEGRVDPGIAHVNPVMPDGKIDQNTYESYDWTAGWNHNQTYSIFGTSWLFQLKEGNGKQDIETLNPIDGTISDGPKPKWWTNGWTHAQIAEQPGELPWPVIFLYKRSTGRLQMRLLLGLGAPDGVTAFDTNVGAGWTTVEPYIVGRTLFLLLYDATTGRYEIRSGTGVKVVEASGYWAKGYATVDSFRTTASGWEATFMYFHNPATGRTRVFDLNPTTGNIRALKYDESSPLGSLAFDVDGRQVDARATEFYMVGDKAYLFRIDRVSGDWTVQPVSAAGVPGKAKQSGRWTPGWDGAQVFGNGHLFLHKSGV